MTYCRAVSTQVSHTIPHVQVLHHTDISKAKQWQHKANSSSLLTPRLTPKVLHLLLLLFYTKVWHRANLRILFFVSVCNTEEIGRMKKKVRLTWSEGLWCHILGQCDIFAEQWSPRMPVREAHVTEMLAPGVKLTCALQCGLKIQNPRPYCTNH